MIRKAGFSSRLDDGKGLVARPRFDHCRKASLRGSTSSTRPARLEHARQGLHERCPGTTRSVMTTDRQTRLVPSFLDIASWLKRLPSAEDVRPTHCPACGAASRVLGQPLGLRSHGLRQRRVRGSQAPGEPLVTLTIRARRYLCRCGAVTLVVPAGVLAHRRYTASAVTVALTLYGLSRLRARHIGACLTGHPSMADWPSLRRWCHQVRDGALFPVVRPAPMHWGHRRVAERVVTTLAACAPPSIATRPLAYQACVGASHPEAHHRLLGLGATGPHQLGALCPQQRESTRGTGSPGSMAPVSDSPRIPLVRSRRRRSRPGSPPGHARREPARPHPGSLHSERTTHSPRNSTACPPLPTSAMGHSSPRRRAPNFHRAPPRTTRRPRATAAIIYIK